MSECKIYRREIEEATDGRGVSTGLRLHVSSCRACGDELSRRESLRALVGGLGKVEAPADFEFRLRARMAAAKAGQDRGRFSGTRWLYSFAPVAVAACFVVVSATLYFRQPARTNTPAASPVVAASPARNVERERAASVSTQSESPESTVEGEQTAKAVPVEMASTKTHRSSQELNTRGRQSRGVAVRNVKRADVEPMTAVSSVSGARVLTLKAPSEPLRVILRDERGAERVVPMRSVSFGSQDFLARGAAKPSAATVEVGGVW